MPTVVVGVIAAKFATTGRAVYLGRSVAKKVNKSLDEAKLPPSLRVQLVWV
jgi:hypothetical protein